MVQSSTTSEAEEMWTMSGPEGIGGKNPIKYAAPELGKTIIERCARLIGEKALGLLGQAE